MWRDKQFGAAVLAAPLFWLALLLIYQPPLDLVWPFHEPWLYLSLAIIYPVLEELVFRGALQGGIYQLRWGRVTIGPLTCSNLATTLLFVAFHFIAHTAWWAVLVIVPSLLFGYFRDKYQSVLPAVLLHAFYNMGYFWLFRPI